MISNAKAQWPKREEDRPQMTQIEQIFASSR